MNCRKVCKDRENDVLQIQESVQQRVTEATTTEVRCQGGGRDCLRDRRCSGV
jgi:hypothetical protein